MIDTCLLSLLDKQWMITYRKKGLKKGNLYHTYKKDKSTEPD